MDLKNAYEMIMLNQLEKLDKSGRLNFSVEQKNQLSEDLSHNRILIEKIEDVVGGYLEDYGY